ncbi:hypothetical protein MLD38_029039 [Melastoma candidum]|uniref:Uncharacterized protein n=1 Tax=Melastoma candidum TaxID=119954 RepID=A0ACB9N2V2_9MYRT|nr:hypothetical protein MLD38_029039 [Melastoma candidum]
MTTTGTGTGTAAVIGLTAGKRLLSSSAYYSAADFADRLVGDRCLAQYPTTSAKSCITVARSSRRDTLPPAKAFRERTASFRSPPVVEPAVAGDDDPFDRDLDDLLLLQKSMLETQWNLGVVDPPGRRSQEKLPVTGSGLSARQRRIASRRKASARAAWPEQCRITIDPELLQQRSKGYVRGVVSNDLLTQSEVGRLSEKIRAGLSLEDQRSRLKERLGCEPTEDQLSRSLKMSRSELRAKTIEIKLAREKLAMSNVRLVMSIAQRYDNMGVEMSDLVQGGLIGLLRGIEKFDSSKGFKISTYVYWWIRQGVSRALVENARTLRLPAHLHERLGLIRNARVRLEGKGIEPSIDNIAKCLNISQKKVRNATEAIGKVFSLDTDAFPSLNGLPGETHHSYIADRCTENNPWHGVHLSTLKEDVNNLMSIALSGREIEIIRLYHGFDGENLTWEDISKRIGLSRERVRQLGLVAMEKLKHIARKRKMEAMLQER